MQTGLGQLPQKAVVQWNIKPIWFAIMAVCHPRWEVSDERLELVRKKGFFNGYKTSEGKTLSKKMEKVLPGDVVKMVCSDKLVWLGLKKGDSFLITITNVQEYLTWEAMLDDSTLENLLPNHVLSTGEPQKYNRARALKVYQVLFYWGWKAGRPSMRCDEQHATNNHK